LFLYRDSIEHVGPITHRRTGSFRVTGDPVGDGRHVPYEFDFEVFDAWSLEAQAFVLHSESRRAFRQGSLRTDGEGFGTCVHAAIMDAHAFECGNIHENMHFVVRAYLRRATAISSLQCRPAPLKNATATLIQYVPPHWQERGDDQRFSIRTWDREDLLAWGYEGAAEVRSPYELRLDELWAMDDAGRAMAAQAEKEAAFR
jgi:hypothetical protein